MVDKSNIALISKDEQLTYDEMLVLADEIASHVEPRSLVFLVTSNTVPAVAGYGAAHAT